MDLTTKYLGLDLRTPLVPSASPLSEDIDKIRHMEDVGASAIVLPSLFEEQLTSDSQELHHHLSYGTDSFAEALTFFPEPVDLFVGPESYLELIRKSKQAVDVPIIASLNGVTDGGWINYAKQIEEAGADALELNIYYIPSSMDVTGAEVEQNYIDILKDIKAVVNIPVAIKVSPFFSNMANMAKRFEEVGAEGLVLFNRFYQPDIDLEHLAIEPHILFSTAHAIRLPLAWLGLLYGRTGMSLAATSGIQTAHDVLKMVMVGADVTMLCSALYRHGIHHIQTIESDLKQWMLEHEYESISQMKGSMSQLNCDDPSAFERTQYMKAITSHFPVRP
ncbi:MAG: dihydroorotate dehydrogenase (fumarate) [bacterium]|jgi:dihydroorotate dehydrogenase (fumarate)